MPVPLPDARAGWQWQWQISLLPRRLSSFPVPSLKRPSLKYSRGDGQVASGKPFSSIFSPSPPPPPVSSPPARPFQPRMMRRACTAGRGAAGGRRLCVVAGGSGRPFRPGNGDLFCAAL
ncbi:hypothetical protein PR202_ga15465 [Eleusine coracana subsp. coracana]|uniref:Uncharacterized protein n=1 Tax=Eleusine coracana subsp. coracana TaxID=191504 RepID=A0AAV5CKG1_ELECO|nr:hypothetical protein PR202_ga15465 [Eleusine coracana subsp. coracana]